MKEALEWGIYAWAPWHSIALGSLFALAAASRGWFLKCFDMGMKGSIGIRNATYTWVLGGEMPH